MKSSFRRSLSLAAVYSAAAVLAQAHPGHAGHEGGDVTWDLSHLAAHPLATFVIAAMAGVAVWAVWQHLRGRGTDRVQSLRNPADNR